MSYGGSGAGTSDFGKWSEHATLNATLIDVDLVPYTELLNSHYFPGDTSINRKRETLKDAYTSYYAQQGELFPDDINQGNQANFFKTEPAMFQVELIDFNFIKSEIDINHVIGRITFGWVDALANDTRILTIFQRNPFNGLAMRTNEDVTIGRQLPVFLIPQAQLSGARIALEGLISRQWGLSEYKHFPRMSSGTEVGKISESDKDLGNLVPGQTEVVSVLLNSEKYSFEFRIRFRVKRIK